MSISTDPRLYALLIAVIAALGAIISTLEWISNRRQLMDDGLFSWQVVGTRPLALGQGLHSRILSWLLSFRPYLGVLILRFVALLFLPLAIWLDWGALFALAAIVATTLLLNFRSPFGMDGSDQMSTQIFGALFLGYLAGSRLGIEASLWFIAAQACLSYFTSGLAKALSPYWRAGDVVFAIFNTRTYGYEPVARFLYGRPGITRISTWGAVVMETIFPLALLLGFPGCLIFIAWGVVFHLMNAVVMGLNSFFWSFVATYPAVIYTAIVINKLLYTHG